MELLEGRLIYTLHGHKGAVITVAFSRAGDLFSSGGADRQVLLWRTNFDRKPYQDVLQQHSQRSTPDPPPHLSDIHPRAPHLHHPQPAAIQISPAVADTQSTDPHVIDLGPAAPHIKASFNDLPVHHYTSSRVEGWTGGESASSADPAAGNRTGADISSKGKGRREEEEMAHTHPLEVLSTHPSSLDFTLQHIVQQLDILTQTVSVLEERLTLTEDKMKECLQHQSQILKDIQASGERPRMSSDETDGSPLHFT
ncbi:POC1 centriolar protein-like protein B-like [Nothobranchius furzeri]|uniref:POC1 centriolar protein homolog B n=4 Tax=Nothobranchius TaxID=28779 RepID=A0A9D3BXT5_NOTFU|nr:POC1 centriolar protein-like protein B-like [Nothobranchius furzeri]